MSFKNIFTRISSNTAIVLVLGLGLSACTTIKPTQPSAPPVATLPPLATSTITVPVRIDVSAIAGRLDEVLPTSQGNASVLWVTGKPISSSVALQIGVHRAGPTSVTTDGGCLNVAVPLAINSGRIDWSEKVGFIRVSKHFDFGGAIRVSARACFGVDSNWNVVTTVAPNFQWLEGAWVDINPPIGHIKIGISELVEPKMREKLPAIAKRISDTVNALPLRSMVERAWAAAQKPVELAKQPAVTLDLMPIALGIGAPTSAGNDLVIRPSIAAKLRTHLGVGVPVAVIKPLPANIGSMGEDAFALSLQTDASFVDLNQLVAQKLAGKSFDLGDGKSVKIGAASLSAMGKQLLLRVDFDAKLGSMPFANTSGWLYFTGIPTFDDKSGHLQMTGLDFDLSTRNLLIKSADALLHRQFVQRLQQAVDLDLTTKLNPLRKRVEEGVLGKEVANGVKLNVLVTSFDVSDIHVASHGIGIFTTARGSANLVVDPAR